MKTENEHFGALRSRAQILLSLATNSRLSLCVNQEFTPDNIKSIKYVASLASSLALRCDSMKFAQHKSHVVREATVVFGFANGQIASVPHLMPRAAFKSFMEMQDIISILSLIASRRKFILRMQFQQLQMQTI